VEKLELHYDQAQLRKYEQLQELQEQAAAAAAARQAASALAEADAAAAARAGSSPAAQFGLDVEDEEISMGTWDVFGEWLAMLAAMWFKSGFGCCF
jgi:seryl-tRNA(Sec) selenium transferase